MTLEGVRDMALALRGTTESPHFRYTTFRRHGRIYATAPRTGESLNVFLDEPERERAVARNPAACSLAGWGKRILGVRVDLARADPAEVRQLLAVAWKRKEGTRR